MRSRRVVPRPSGAGLAIVDDTVPPREVVSGWLTQRRFDEVEFATGEPLDFLLSEALVAADAGRTGDLLALWTETLKQHASTATPEAEQASPFAAAPGGLALPGEFLDSQPANFIHEDGALHRIDTEWEAAGPVDFGLVCMRGLYHFAVGVFTRGISAQRVDGRDVATLVMALARAAGVEHRAEALERLPAAEGALQALVRGWPEDRGRSEVERILQSTPHELTVVAGVPSGSPTSRDREVELQAELDQLRLAHDAQGRQMIAQRLALAEQVEQEVTSARDVASALREEIAGLREELSWRTGVMEHQAEAIEHHKQAFESILMSRSFRLTAPLRSIAGLFRR
jgi:hypothetical protein